MSNQNDMIRLLGKICCERRNHISMFESLSNEFMKYGAVIPTLYKKKLSRVSRMLSHVLIER